MQTNQEKSSLWGRGFMMVLVILVTATISVFATNYYLTSQKTPPPQYNSSQDKEDDTPVTDVITYVTPTASTCITNQVSIDGSCKNYSYSKTVSAGKDLYLLGKLDNGTLVFWPGIGRVVLKTPTTTSTYRFTVRNGGVSTPIVAGNNVYYLDANLDLNQTYVFKLNRTLGRFTKVRTINTYVNTFIASNYMDATQNVIFTYEAVRATQGLSTPFIRKIKIKEGTVETIPLVSNYNNTLPIGSDKKVGNITNIAYENGYVYALVTNTTTKTATSTYSLLKMDVATPTNVVLASNQNVSSGVLYVKNGVGYITGYDSLNKIGYFTKITNGTVETVKVADLIKLFKPTFDTVKYSAAVSLKGIDNYGNVILDVYFYGDKPSQGAYPRGIFLNDDFVANNLSTYNGYSHIFTKEVKGSFNMKRNHPTSTTADMHYRMNITY
jgi:hypothetical protein